jgi:hypothetical protein
MNTIYHIDSFLGKIQLEEVDRLETPMGVKSIYRNINKKDTNWYLQTSHYQNGGFFNGNMETIRQETIDRIKKLDIQ